MFSSNNITLLSHCDRDMCFKNKLRALLKSSFLPLQMENESSQQFCLRWHNHQSSVLGGLPALLDSGRLTDVTLCAGGRSLRAHRIVLSTCSPYFMDIFKELPSSQQPVIVVLGGGWAELCCLVAFMYAGEVTLPRSLLPGLLKLAAALRITGLTDLNGNIPKVPPQTEFEDSFNSKLDTNYSADETTLNRQNDSASSTENLTSPFQKSFETHLAAKSMEPLSSQSCKSESHTPLGEPYQDKIEYGTRNLSLREGKRSGKGNENKRYLNPVLNEIEPKNRKIDKIVENLKCNQRKSHEIHSPVSRGKSQLTDLQKTFLNLSSSNMEHLERISAQKLSSPDMLPRSKAADIFAGSNIFMETDPDNHGTGCDLSTDSVPNTIKTETDSSPEIIPDLKYIPLSPGIQSVGIHSPTNTKLYAACYVCHKQLSNQYNLRVHLETHQNARHACVACSHVSRSRDALRKHVSYRHPQLNTSHSVGRPCKANANQNTSSTLQTPLSVSSIFSFPSPAVDAGESIDLSANTNTNTRHSSGADVTNATRSSVSVDNNNGLSNSVKMPTEKHD